MSNKNNEVKHTGFISEDFSFLSRKSVSLEALSLSLIICLSFTFQLFSITGNSRYYALIICSMTTLYILSRPNVKVKLNPISLLWIITMLVIVINYLFTQKAEGPLMDIIILSCGVLLILFCSLREKVYKKCIKIIICFGVLFAFGVYVQRFLPSLYDIFIRILPDSLANEIGKVTSENYTRGFSTNPGFTAGYICAGIIAIMSSINLLEVDKLRLEGKILQKLILIAILLIALFFTGKRGHALFLLLTIAICYILSSKGSDRLKRCGKILSVVLFSTIMLFLFRDFLTKIPLLSRVMDTFHGIIEGEDVSSARLGLYKWAWRLFTENPLIGIGWGNYRTTVVGNVTFASELDTHNIYLQLLTETGIIGFLCASMTFAVFWVITKNAYYQCLVDNSINNSSWKQILLFSFAYQTFFLLYGLTGNVFFEQHYQLIYMFACSIVIAYRFKTIQSKANIVSN